MRLQGGVGVRVSYDTKIPVLKSARHWISHFLAIFSHQRAPPFFFLFQIMKFGGILIQLTTMFVITNCQNPSETNVINDDSVNCYYCGIKDNCELPYDTDDGKIIKCDKSCVKFDGYARDGKRIVVRNCGYFTGK